MGSGPPFCRDASLQVVNFLISGILTFLGKQIFVVRISVINLCARITKPCARFTNPCARFTNLCARINYANPYGLLSRAHGLLIGVHGFSNPYARLSNLCARISVIIFCMAPPGLHIN